MGSVDGGFVMASCCGCHLEDDYGTSLAHGTGELNDPFTLEQVDPNFRRPMVRVTRTDLALTGGVVTTLSWVNVTFDTVSMWNAGTPADVVLPIDGLYLVGLQVDFNFAAGLRELIIQHNGVEIYRTEYQSASLSEMPLSYLVVGREGDILQGKVRSSVNVDLNNAALWACFLGKKV